MSDLQKPQILKPFTRFCMTIGNLPSSYLVSLTYEEQLLWLCDYLQNTVIPTVNNNGECVTELQNLYLQLKNYVDNYFTNLDVQNEIDAKLDEMAEDGTLASIINNDLFSNLDNKILQNAIKLGALEEEIEDTVKTTDSNIINMSMLNQEVREALTGGSTAVVGVNSVDTDNIVNNAITIYKLDNLLEENFTKEYSNINFGNPVQGNYKKVVDNAIVNVTDNAYEYFNISLDNKTIYNFSGFNMYNANGIIVYDPNDNNRVVYYSTITNPATNFEYIKLIFRTNKTGLKAYINIHLINQTTNAKYNLLPTLTKIKELTQNKKENYVEKIKELEHYIAAYNTKHTTFILDFNDTVPCGTEIYKLSKGTKYKVNSANIYSNCGLVILNEKLETSYLSNTQNIGNQPVPFSYEFIAEDDGYALLQYIQSKYYTLASEIYIERANNKYKSLKWTLLGDSLTDPNVNSSVKKYYSYIQDDLGIQIQNLGQSGCGYKRKLNGNNFVEQSLLIDNDADVVTIFGSFNDHNIYDTDGLGNITDTTTNTIFGCVNTTIQNIITNRPNVKIGIILPTPWNYSHANPYDPTEINLQYIEGIRTIAKKYSIPVLDLFYESNMYPWNSNFREMFYVSSDGTHPNTDGNKRFAYKIEEFLKTLI